jgi:hypothetical protein
MVWRPKLSRRAAVEASATVSSPDPSEPPPARLIEATGLLHDIRVSLDARCETESEEDEGREIPWLGVGVALAAFLPTFLSIVLGGPLLLATALPPARQGPALAQVGGPPLPTAPTEALSWPDDRPLGNAWNQGDGVAPRPDGGPTKARHHVGRRELDCLRRAAALADEQAAVRLAGSLRNQGYRVDVRREDDSTLPWVLWTTKGPARRSPK